jgi:hypothetical protein
LSGWWRSRLLWWQQGRNDRLQLGKIWLEFRDKLVYEEMNMVDDALIFDILERPAIRFGRKLALLVPDVGVKAIDFGFYPFCLQSLSPTPWKRAWAKRGRLWYHLNKSNLQCQVIDESDLPVYRDSGSVYPGTWLIEESDDGAILGANALGGEHPQLGVTSKSGFHLYYLRNQGLELVNLEPIPYLVWSAWREGDFLILAGMTQRSISDWSDQDDPDVSLGRPALIRCSLTGDRWEEISLMGTPNSDANILGQRFDELGLDRILQFETWGGSAHVEGHGRILLAMLARKKASFFDSQDAIPVQPLESDYSALAFVSRESGEVIHVEASARLILTLYTPQKNLFVICRKLAQGARIVEGLHILDLESHGLLVREMHIEGLDTLTPFTSLSAAYFGEEGFFGALECEEDTVFIHSRNGVNWTVLEVSSKIDCWLDSDFNEADRLPRM